MTPDQIIILNELVAQRDQLAQVLAANPNTLFTIAPLLSNLPADVRELLDTKRAEAETSTRTAIQNRITTISQRIDGIGVTNFPESSIDTRGEIS